MLKMSLMAAATILSGAALAEGPDLQITFQSQSGLAPAGQVFGQAVPNLAVVFDQGPASGNLNGCWQNQTETQNFADIVKFTKTTQVQGITIFTCAAPVANATVHLKILSHGLQGFPGYLLRKEDGVPTSWTASTASGVGYAVTYTFAKPFRAVAGGSYWFGLSGNGFDLSQDSVLSPANGMMAQFYGKSFKFNTILGDQMFQLLGQ